MAAVEYESSDFFRLSFNIVQTIYTVDNYSRLAFVARSANHLFCHETWDQRSFCGQKSDVFSASGDRKQALASEIGVH
tara:strand:+ start:827 stop:1060 length:234 start_codon:yes stop_codon:yes gene_type:complete